MKRIAQTSLAIVSLLAASGLSAQVCDVNDGGSVWTDGKSMPATLVCRGGPALEWATGYGGTPSRVTARILKFTLASRPAGAQGLGLQPSQCGLTDRPFTSQQHLAEVRMDPASTTFTTGTAAPVTSSLEDYLRDINHFWSFDVKICVTPQRRPRPLQASAHRRLEVPRIVDTARTPGSPLDQARATTGKTSTSGASQQSQVDPASQVMLNPQPLPPRTTVLRSKDPPVIAGSPMQTTSAERQTVDPQSQIQGTARGRGVDVPQGLEALLCRGGSAPAIGPYPLKTQTQMMYFVPSESPARADGSGLAPHRCSFTDQVPGNTGSNIVLFEGTEAQGQIVARSLESADVFWRFLGKRNESGYFEATMNEQWQPVGNTTSNISAVRFIRLRVTPGTRNVVFTFEGPPDAAPRVMVVNGPLQKLPGGTYRSEGAPLHLKAVRNSDIRNSGLVQFIAASDQHHDPQASDEWLTMGPGKHYHYFIFEKGSTSRQEGTFTTLAEFSPAVEATLQPERADPPVNQAVLAPANSAPIPAKSQLPGR